jgi:hypothetical protein
MPIMILAMPEAAERPSAIGSTGLGGDWEVLNLPAVAEATQPIQEFHREGAVRLDPRKPITDKQMRMSTQAAQIENGFVYIPKEAHWLAE